MKTIKFITLGILLLVAVPNQAQVSVNLNVGTPSWGPAVTTQEYYYLPDVNSYYDIRSRQFIYFNNGGWIRANQLAPQYRGYNLKGGNVIVLHDYHGHSPYTHYKSHKIKYGKGNSGNHYQKKGNGNSGNGNNGNGNGNGKHKGNKGNKGK